MSDFDDDIDNQLLELAGATEKKRKRLTHPSKSSTSKKRKADPMQTDSEVGPESEEEDSYPLEGKYADEEDREKLLKMSEFERERVIAARLEKKQRLVDKRMLSQMVKSQKGGTDDSIAQAAKRPHSVRGATKDKSRKLDELKAKRKAKDDRKRNTSPKHDRSSSPMDMEISDDESEDGQISQHDYDPDKDKKASKVEVDDQPSTLEDIEKCRISRDLLAKHCMAPWFGKYVEGAWVRYLIGQEKGQAVYRMCEVTSASGELVKPYKINDKTVNQALNLKHGDSTRAWNMDKVSNGPFVEKEFERLVRVCASEKVKLPTKRQVEEQVAKMHQLTTQPMTESDINAMLARKNQLQAATKPTGLSTMERSRMNQARTLAMRRQDYAEVAEIDAKLAELGANESPNKNRTETVDMLAKVNERNRKANLEAVRKAEFAETERKKRERKLAASGGAPIPQDPSARLKTVPRMFNVATPTSRPGTPQANDSLAAHTHGAGLRPVSPLPPSALSGKTNGASKSLETSIIETLEIDLGDF